MIKVKTVCLELNEISLSIQSSLYAYNFYPPLPYIL